MGFFEPTPLPQFDQNSQVSLSPYLPNISVGNPTIDMVMSMMLGGTGRVAPRPIGGQSVQDAFQSRDRSLEFIKAMRSSFSGSLLSQKMGGIDTDNPMGQIMAMIAGNPNGLVNNPIMKAFNGGNPVQAQMGMLKNFTGMSYQALTGNLGNMSASESNDLMQGFTESMFHTKKYGQKDIDEDKAPVIKDIMDAINDPKSQGRMNQFIDGDGKLDEGKLKAVVEGADEQAKNLQKQLQDAVGDQYKKVFDKYSSIKDIDQLKGKTIADSVNFEATRGFESQDLTKSFAMANDLGLFNSGKYRDAAMKESLGQGHTQREAEADGMKATGGQYIKNATRVLRATADLTGDTTAEGAMTSLNQLLGRSTHDLGDEGDARRIEELLRKVKGSARVAGVSIDAMKGIIGEIRGMTEHQADLQYSSDTRAMEMGVKAMSETYSIQGALGQAYVRNQGGANAVLQQQGQLIASNEDDMPAQNYKGIIGVIASRQDLSQEQKEKLYQRTEKAFMGKDGPKDQNAVTQIFEDLSGADALGTNAQYLMRQVNDPTSRKVGQLEIERQKVAATEYNRKLPGVNEERRKNGQAPLTEKAMPVNPDEVTENTVGLMALQGAELWGMNNTLAPVKGEDGQLHDMDPKERAMAYMQDLGNIKNTGLKPEEVAAKYDLLGSPLDTQLMADPNFNSNAVKWAAKNYQAVDAQGKPTLNDWQRTQRTFNSVRDSSAKDEARTAEELARLQAPIATYAAQFLISSDPKSYDKLMEGLGAGATRDRMGKVLTSTKQMLDDGKPKSFHAAESELLGGTGNVDERKKNLLDQGHTEDQLDGLMHRGDELNDTENQASFDVLMKSGLTVKDVINSSKDYEDDSAAKKAGIKDSDVYGAARYMHGMGLDTPEMLEKHGTEKMDLEFSRKHLRAEQMIPEYTRALEKSLVAPVENRSQKEIDNLIADYNDPESKQSRTDPDDPNSPHHRRGDEELATWKALGEAIKVPDLVKDGRLDLEKAASIDFSTAGDADTSDPTKAEAARKINAQREAVRQTGTFVAVEDFKTHADQIKGSVADINKQLEGKDDNGNIMKHLTDVLGTNGSSITEAIANLTKQLQTLTGS